MKSDMPTLFLQFGEGNSPSTLLLLNAAISLGYTQTAVISEPETALRGGSAGFSDSTAGRNKRLGCGATCYSCPLDSTFIYQREHAALSKDRSAEGILCLVFS